MTKTFDNFASREVASFWRFISSSLARLVTLLDGLDADELNWRPPAPEANSLYALATHTLGNVEENVLETLGGESVHRDREAEFRASSSSAASVQQRWQALRPEVERALAAFTLADLDRPYEHPRRGMLTGREVLIVVARHAAEHLGQAELTHDLLRAHQAKSTPNR